MGCVGQAETHRRAGLLAGHVDRAGGRDPGELGSRRPEEAVHRQHGRRAERGLHRHQGADRLVRAAVDGRAVPGHHRLAQSQQVRPPVQDLRIRRQGATARRGSGLRDQRRRTGGQPGPGLQGGAGRQRNGADLQHSSGPATTDAAARVLLLAAVAVERGADGQDRSAALHGRMRRRSGQDRLRLSGLRPGQDRRDQVRRIRQPGLHAGEELPVDGARTRTRSPARSRWTG